MQKIKEYLKKNLALRFEQGEIHLVLEGEIISTVEVQDSSQCDVEMFTHEGDRVV